MGKDKMASQRLLHATETRYRYLKKSNIVPGKGLGTCSRVIVENAASHVQTPRRVDRTALQIETYIILVADSPGDISS